MKDNRRLSHKQKQEIKELKALESGYRSPKEAQQYINSQIKKLGGIA